MTTTANKKWLAMMSRHLHAVVSGFSLALVLGLLLIPSLTLMAPIEERSETEETFSAGKLTTDNRTMGPPDQGGVLERASVKTVFGQTPTTMVALSFIAVFLIIISFLLVGRLVERTPEASKGG